MQLNHVVPMDSASELDALRGRCREQSVVIDSLTEAVALLRRATSVLKTENAELRAENERIRRAQGSYAIGKA